MTESEQEAAGTTGAVEAPESSAAFEDADARNSGDGAGRGPDADVPTAPAGPEDPPADPDEPMNPA